MFDFLFDLTNDPVFYTLYISLVLSFSVKIALNWMIEYKVSDASVKLKETKNLFANDSIQKIGVTYSFDIFEWLVNITKRKEHPDDKSAPSNSFSTFSYT